MILRRLGRTKYRAMRLFPWITLFNTIQLFRLTEFSWWYVGFGILAIVLYLYEKEYGIAGELDVAWEKSKQWNDFKTHFDKRMDELTAD